MTDEPKSGGPAGAGPGSVASRGVDPRGVGAEGVGPHGVGGPAELDAQRRLETLVADVARGQPLRRAPASLEARVLAQLVPAPWWRRGFTSWPLAARVAFLAASVGFVRFALAGFMSVTEIVGSGEVVGTAKSWAHSGSEVVSITASTGSFVLHAIPPMWLYGAAAFAFCLYALLFGLGTLAYRTLYVER